MKVKFISFSFRRGGAAKAAKRLSDLLPDFFSKEMISVDEYPKVLIRYFHFMKRLISFSFVFIYQKSLGVKCSANLFSFGPALDSLAHNSGVLHLHWINNDTLSIYSLKNIPYFSILTLHDEWLYCGIEHYFDYSGVFNDSPYSLETKDSYKNFDSFLHYYVWSMKVRAFSNRADLIVTCPSNWLAQRAKNSHVLKDCDVRVLYNPINVAVFSPLDDDVLTQKRVSLALGERYLILFGAVGGTKNKLKGFSELQDALKKLSELEEVKNRIVLGLFGASKSGISEIYGFPVYEFGYISNELEMATIYSTAHVIVVPSKIEAFGQVAAESLACGTPVIAFDTSGLKDVVVDGVTGLLAEPFSSDSLAEKIQQIINMDSENYLKLCRSARKHVIDNFSNEVISKHYKAILNEQMRRKQVDCK